MSVLTFFPKNRLAELVGQFGGHSREEAIAAATKELDVMRPQADQAIGSAIRQLERTMADSAKRRACGPEAMKELLPLCDQIVTLAGTYGYGALDKATRSLCDLLDGLLGQGESDTASIQVHVQTIRMMAPGSLALGAEQIDLMLFELAKLLAHHGIDGLEASASKDGEDASIAAAQNR